MADQRIAEAAARLRQYAAYADWSQAEREQNAARIYGELGGDAEDPLMVALVLEEAGEADPAPPVGGPGLLYEVKVATGWADRKIGDTIGMSRATVQAVIGGRLTENVTSEQAGALLEALLRQRTALDRIINKVRRRAAESL